MGVAETVLLYLGSDAPDRKPAAAFPHFVRGPWIEAAAAGGAADHTVLAWSPSDPPLPVPAACGVCPQGRGAGVCSGLDAASGSCSCGALDRDGYPSNRTHLQAALKLAAILGPLLDPNGEM